MNNLKKLILELTASKPNQTIHFGDIVGYLSCDASILEIQLAMLQLINEGKLQVLTVKAT